MERKFDIDDFMTMYQVISSYARKQYKFNWNETEMVKMKKPLEENRPIVKVLRDKGRGTKTMNY